MSDILNKTIVLVLNRNWQAINIRTPQDAFCQMATNVATALEIEFDGSANEASCSVLPSRRHGIRITSGARRSSIPAILSSIARAWPPSRRASVPSGASRNDTRSQSTPSMPVATRASALRRPAMSRAVTEGWPGCEALPSVTKTTCAEAPSRTRRATVPPHPKASSSGCGATTSTEVTALRGRARLRSRNAERITRATARRSSRRPRGVCDHPSVSTRARPERAPWLGRVCRCVSFNCRRARAVDPPSGARTAGSPPRSPQTIGRSRSPGRSRPFRRNSSGSSGG